VWIPLYGLQPLAHKGYLGTPGRTRTSSLRIRSPFRHNPLTGRYTHEPSRSKGFEYSPVRTTLHQFSMKRVLESKLTFPIAHIPGIDLSLGNPTP
jgi:hypothetical protein